MIFNKFHKLERKTGSTSIPLQLLPGGYTVLHEKTVKHPAKQSKDFIGQSMLPGLFMGRLRRSMECAVLVIWLALVIFTATKHEFWRDEVRALSLVRSVQSPLDLYSAIRNEGHPVLWYLILYAAKSLVDSPLVLPIASIVIAFSAVAVFMFASPFPFWIRCLFIFSALPLYEYSVMARNYGISMLLLFVVAFLYRRRAESPWFFASILALLANSNVHSVIFVGLLATLWWWDIFTGRRVISGRFDGYSPYRPFLLVLGGILLCVLFTYPRENTIVTSVHHSANIEGIIQSLYRTLVSPGEAFFLILPVSLPQLASGMLLFLAMVGLVHNLPLFFAALGGELILGVFFREVYVGSYRHQGLLLVFFLVLYWIALDSSEKSIVKGTRRLLFNLGLFVAVVAILGGNFLKAKSVVMSDIKGENSSSRAFGEYLNRSGIYGDAIIVPEPDYLAESLPYYAKNTIYLPREHRFGTTASFTTASDCRLSLGKLLSLARDVKAQFGRPVLIVLGHWEVGGKGEGKKIFSYNKVFSWNSREMMDFKDSTALVKEFSAAGGDENYRVYLLN